MNIKTWIPLILAIALGVIAMVVARKALHPSSGGDEPTTIAMVAIAKRDVPPGTSLTGEDVNVVKMPAAHAPSRAFSNAQDLMGRVPPTGLVKGQEILETELAPVGTGSGLPSVIPEGMRAFTIEVNEFSGLAGMLLPGAHVDIVTVVRDEKAQQPMSRTILQNIHVAAVGRNLSAAPSPDGQLPPPSNNVTLLVSPKQAQTLQLAMQAGRPWLVLRNGRDVEMAEIQVTSMADLNSRNGDTGPTDPFGGNTKEVIYNGSTTQPTTQPVAVARNVRMVQVINAGVLSQIEVPLPTTTSEQSAPALEPRSMPRPDMAHTDQEEVSHANTPEQSETSQKPKVPENLDTEAVRTPESDKTGAPEKIETGEPSQTAVEPQAPKQAEVPTDEVIPSPTRADTDPGEIPGASIDGPCGGDQFGLLDD